MVYKCCVPNCPTTSIGSASTGSAADDSISTVDSSSKREENKSVSVHKFPEDSELFRKWIKAIPRRNWSPTKYTRICSHHLSDRNFVNEYIDSNKSRRKNKKSSPTKRTLKKDAEPTLFSNLPSYLSKTESSESSTTTTCSARFKAEVTRQKNSTEVFLNSSHVSTLKELQEKMMKEILPKDV